MEREIELNLFFLEGMSLFHIAIIIDSIMKNKKKEKIIISKIEKNIFPKIVTQPTILTIYF